MATIQCAVAKAYPNDVGRGIARVPTYLIDALEVSPFTAIEVKGSTTTSATALRLAELEPDTRRVYIDKITRMNAGVKVNDPVTIREVKVPDADCVQLLHRPEFTPLPPTSTDSADDYTLAPLPDGLRQRLLDRVVAEGDLVPVTFGQSCEGTTLPLAVLSTDPGGVCVITETTDIEISENVTEMFVFELLQ
jgi:transitional endoplasmic reticulum ATPase